MKAAIILFVVALAISTILNDQDYPKYPMKPGVMNVAQSASGMKRGETMIPETQIKDGYRKVFYMSGVADGDDNVQTEFPMQALQ